MQKFFFFLVAGISGCITAPPKQSPPMATVVTTTPLGAHLQGLSCGPQVLFVLDLDDVLLYPQDPLFQSQNKGVFKTTSQKVRNDLGAPKAMDIHSRMLMGLTYQTLDPQLPQVLAQLQKCGSPVLILTHTMAGPYGLSQAIENPKLAQLKALGYTFSHKWRPGPFPAFSALPQPRGYAPFFKEGVLFAAGVDKGLVLKTFLEAQGWKPHTVVCVDDKIPNIEAVARAAQRLHIGFAGVLYTGKEQYGAQTLNPQEAQELLWEKVEQLSAEFPP